MTWAHLIEPRAHHVGDEVPVHDHIPPHEAMNMGSNRQSMVAGPVSARTLKASVAAGASHA